MELTPSLFPSNLFSKHWFPVSPFRGSGLQPLPCHWHWKGTSTPFGRVLLETSCLCSRFFCGEKQALKSRIFSNVLAVGSVKKRCSFAVKLECGFLQMWWYVKMAYSKGVFSENIKIDLNSLCHEAEIQSWCTFKMFPGITDAYLPQYTPKRGRGGEEDRGPPHRRTEATPRISGHSSRSWLAFTYQWFPINLPNSFLRLSSSIQSVSEIPGINISVNQIKWIRISARRIWVISSKSFSL